jgi:hypothetical protein
LGGLVGFIVASNIITFALIARVSRQSISALKAGAEVREDVRALVNVIGLEVTAGIAASVETQAKLAVVLERSMN